MIYAISDLHGCYERYIKMLEKIAFCDTDTLYVLGDIIDRGPGGIDILLDMLRRPNVRPLLGNHESVALGPMRQIALSPALAAAIPHTAAYRRWMCSDGEPTAASFGALDRETQRAIASYIRSFPVRTEVTVGGRRFHLSHTLPEYRAGFDPGDVPGREFIFGEPDYEIAYADGILFLTGHTPTALIDPECEGRIYQKNGHIAIDCGAVFGCPLGCICLDTGEEFYMK